VNDVWSVVGRHLGPHLRMLTFGHDIWEWNLWNCPILPFIQFFNFIQILSSLSPARSLLLSTNQRLHLVPDYNFYIFALTV
jgi:hypothetical protein